MGRRFVTAEDIDELAAAGRSRLEVDARTTLTDLARERAHDRGVAIVEVEDADLASGGRSAARSAPGGLQGATVTASRPAATSHHGAPVVIGASDLPRRRLRAAVRAAVVAELGTTPEGVDAAIGRVLDRFDITD